MTQSALPASTAGHWHCKKCNKSVATWGQHCPHCRCLGSIKPGKPKEGPGAYQDEVPQRLDEVKNDESFERISTGTREFDRVLGGGLVIGSAVLIAGDPGIGKSTLLTQTAIDLTLAEIIDEETNKPDEPYRCLYINAEETNNQVKLRAERLSRDSADLFLYHQINVFEIDKAIEEIEPDVCYFDSIQMMVHPGHDAPAGSVTQVNACAEYLIGICKARGIPCFIVAHITKDGTIAGPKTLEHRVDAVLEFHKEGQTNLRSIRASKNRFGDTTEMALFQMTAAGLKSIENPSELLLEHHKDGVTGICIGIAADGSRPMAVEVQTLLMGTAPFGDDDEDGKPKKHRPHKRYVTGLDQKRVNQVMAVISKRAGVFMDPVETYVSIAGGIELKDPGMDLPLALALISSALDRPLPAGLCAFGEIGLGGEIRQVPFSESRVKAAELMGFATIVGPNRPDEEDGEEEEDEEEVDLADALAQSEPPGTLQDPDDDDDEDGPVSEYVPAATLDELVEMLFGDAPLSLINVRGLLKAAKLERAHSTIPAAEAGSEPPQPSI